MMTKNQVGVLAQEAAHARDKIQEDADLLRRVGLTDIANRLHSEANHMWRVVDSLYCDKLQESKR